MSQDSTLISSDKIVASPVLQDSAQECADGVVLESTGGHQILVNVLEYLVMFFVILDFNTAYKEYEPLDSYLVYASVGITMMLLVLRSNSFKIEGILVIYYIGSLLPLLNVFPGTEKQYIKLFWGLLPVFILYLSSLGRIGFNQIVCFLLKYSNIMVLLALVSLVYWIFGSNLEIIQPTMYIPNSWKGNGVDLIPTYHLLYFETQETSFMGYDIVRNSGIFNEGPMHNMALCTALSMELFLRPIKSVWRIVILSVTILTTFTTTGILFLGLMAAWVIFKFFSHRGRILLIAILPVLAIVMMIFSNLVIEDKESSKGEESVKVRVLDIETCIEIGLENPILGQGLFTQKLGENQGGFYGFSNSLFTLFADGGFYTVFLYIAALVLIPLRYYSLNRKESWPLMMFSFFLVFVVTISHFRQLTLLLVAFGCSLQATQGLNDDFDEDEAEKTLPSV